LIWMSKISKREKPFATATTWLWVAL
jgi:hypothetical protein